MPLAASTTTDAESNPLSVLDVDRSRSAAPIVNRNFAHAGLGHEPRAVLDASGRIAMSADALAPCGQPNMHTPARSALLEMTILAAGNRICIRATSANPACSSPPPASGLGR